METGLFLIAGRRLALLFTLHLLLLIGAHPSRGDGIPAAPDARNYCNVPPLAGSGIKPNLLLMMDNSASMYDPAYTNTSSDPPTYCLDDSYDDGAAYLGYFEPAAYYRYDFAAGSFKFAADQTGIPATGACGAARVGGYLCVNTVPEVDGLGYSYQRVDNFLARGNFLNWLAMSKLDIEKKALTGGKYDPDSGLLHAETRGCQGRRFVKLVRNGPLSQRPVSYAPITFAVRGPIPSESEYSYQSGRGGLTRIEVYATGYNKDACLAAVSAWQERKGKDAVTDAALACMDNQYDSNYVPTQGKVYTEIMSDCYGYLADGTMSFDASLLEDCRARVSWIYLGNPFDIVKNTGDDVCGRGVFHNLTYFKGMPHSDGYLGNCFDWMFGFDGPNVQECVLGQTLDYCKDLAHPWLTDPSVTANMTGTTLNVPGFILEAGISNLGQVSGTLTARIATQAPPSGLVQKYGSQINFGAMVFNDNGAGSECGDPASPIPCVKHCQYDPAPQKECAQASDCLNAAPDACREDPHRDGGRVISYLNHSPLGDHHPGTGLVAAIDAVTANSWTPWAETFYEAIGYFANRSVFRLQPADFDEAWKPSQYSCQKNNILMVTDGISTADRVKAVSDYVAAAQRDWGGAGGMPASQTTSSSDPASAGLPFQGSYNLDDLAWIARHKNIFDPGRAIVDNKDFISSYVVYTGAPCGDPATGTGYRADGSCVTTDEGVPEKMMQLVADKGGGRFLSAQRPADLESALASVFQQIGTGSNAGTDASIVSTGDANGAIFLQELFYPTKSFDGGVSSASWLGELQALWYYLDPLVGTTGGASTIREDTGATLTLDLKRDRVVRFGFDALLNDTRASLYLDANGDGNTDPAQPSGYPLSVAPEAVQSLWRAGLQLWSRDPATRTVYTQTDGRNLTLINPGSLEQQQLLLARGLGEAQGIVSFVKGTDLATGRKREIGASGSGTRQVWKLGDIISSTPVVQSATGLAGYSLPPPRGYGDLSYLKFLAGDYRKRGTVYVGANDGMLHAFRLGSLQVQPGEGGERWPASRKAVLTGADLGREEWAFIPKNALPYLRYLQEPGYPHLYYVDGSSTLADVSLGDPATCGRTSYWSCLKDNVAGSNWRTVLIGGMGLGGATRGSDASCSEGAAGNCVKAPRTDAGLSSYFALDVTGQRGDGTAAPPSLLWEFSPPGLGFATSGAAILKINATSEPESGKRENGRWFAVFASGPTGSIDSGTCQFQGTSDQNLRLFVVDLNAVPPLAQGVNYWVIDTGIGSAFGGSLSAAGIDADRWNAGSRGHYEDDALYLGYTRKAQEGVWTGGVLRLLTRENPDPAQWVVSPVIDGIGPVTGSISKLQDRKNHELWLYFGTGRYFHNQDDLTTDRALFGVKEPCYRPDDTLTPVDGTLCSAAPLGLGDLANASDAAAPTGSGTKGWWIGLDPAAGGFGAERLTANPTALTGGVVYFPSFKPSSDPCRQGVSYLWGVRYDSGGSAALNGKALVPLSDASSGELGLSGWSDRGGRRSPQLGGKPGGAKLVTNSGLKPLKKIIHIQER